MGDGVWLGEGSEVHPSAKIDGPVIIGDYCRIGAGAHLREYSVLGSNVRVGEDAFIHRAIIHDNAYLAAGVQLRGCVIGRAGDLRRGARCEEGVVLGDECFVGEHAVINPGVKVYPFKTVEPGAIVNSSIVWESRGARHLFGRLGVSGLANVDISPELAVRLAMAYATTLKRGSTVVTSRDTSRAARVLKRALMVGLNSAGVDCSDLEVATIPLTRFQVHDDAIQGGITVRLAPDDPQSVIIRFFDADGIDINEATQRKIERSFYREDFRRALAGEIGDIGFPVRTVEHYTAILMEQVDVEAIRAARMKVVLDYAFGSASFVMPNVLSKLGAEVLTVNPYASTRQALSFDRWRHAGEVGELVRAAGAQIGAVLDSDGEHLTLVDETGHVLSDDEGLLTLLRLVLDTSDKPTVALPVSSSRAVEEMCRAAGATLIWTKVSTPHLMETASMPGIDFASSQEGGYIFPSFLPAYDAVATLVIVLGLLAKTGRPLSEVVSGLPRIHIAHESVVTPWDQKGLVMRTVVEQAKDRETIVVDGVKVIHDDGWALVLPDPEEPVTHVWAEGASDTQARALAQEYTATIRQMLQ
jgi:mannose-1-phosphate guanylyltransferase/phosphomannomutase